MPIFGMQSNYPPWVIELPLKSQVKTKGVSLIKKITFSKAKCANLFLNLLKMLYCRKERELCFIFFQTSKNCKTIDLFSFVFLIFLLFYFLWVWDK